MAAHLSVGHWVLLRLLLSDAEAAICGKIQTGIYIMSVCPTETQGIQKLDVGIPLHTSTCAFLTRSRSLWRMRTGIPSSVLGQKSRQSSCNHRRKLQQTECNQPSQKLAEMLSFKSWKPVDCAMGLLMSIECVMPGLHLGNGTAGQCSVPVASSSAVTPKETWIALSIHTVSCCTLGRFGDVPSK